LSDSLFKAKILTHRGISRSFLSNGLQILKIFVYFLKECLEEVLLHGEVFEDNIQVVIMKR
jgi:hypothetical protein